MQQEHSSVLFASFRITTLIRQRNPGVEMRVIKSDKWREKLKDRLVCAITEDG